MNNRWADSGIAIISMRGDWMHFEILVEDQSGKRMLDTLIPKIICILTPDRFTSLPEQAAENLFGNVPEVFRAPALPLGRQFNGSILSG